MRAQFELLRCQLMCVLRPIGRLVAADQDHLAAPPQVGVEAQRLASSIGVAVMRAARYGVFRPSCLVRALAVRALLRSHDIHGSELRLGVRLEDGSLLAHAWVELHGSVIGDSPRQIRGLIPAVRLRLVEL